MSVIRSVVVSTSRSRAALLGALALSLAACSRADTEPAAAARDTAAGAAAGGAAGGTMLAGSAALLGRWQKPEQTLPPVTLELRADAADRVTGQVWLSGVTYDGPAVLDDSSVVLRAAGRPTLRGVRLADGRLRVQFLKEDGSVDREERLVKVQ